MYAPPRPRPVGPRPPLVVAPPRPRKFHGPPVIPVRPSCNAASGPWPLTSTVPLRPSILHNFECVKSSDGTADPRFGNLLPRPPPYPPSRSEEARSLKRKQEQQQESQADHDGQNFDSEKEKVIVVDGEEFVEVEVEVEGPPRRNLQKWNDSDDLGVIIIDGEAYVEVFEEEPCKRNRKPCVKSSKLVKCAGKLSKFAN